MKDEFALTGISITNQASKANIDVSVEPNEGGEGYTLAYVLVCERTHPHEYTSAPVPPSSYV
jgi:hypothetical protein